MSQLPWTVRVSKYDLCWDKHIRVWTTANNATLKGEDTWHVWLFTLKSIEPIAKLIVFCISKPSRETASMIWLKWSIISSIRRSGFHFMLYVKHLLACSAEIAEPLLWESSAKMRRLCKHEGMIEFDCFRVICYYVGESWWWRMQRDV